MDSIILANGKINPGNEKTTAIISWIFAGYNLTDTILNLNREKIIIYTSERKSKQQINVVNFLSNVADHPFAKKYNLSFVKKGDENTDNFNRIWKEIHSDIFNPKVASFVKHVKMGAVVE